MLGKYVPQWRFLNVLLGDEPVLTPRVAFYQRLAARDQDEAAEIVEQALATRPIEQVCDDILYPALAEARQDAAVGRLSDEEVTFVTRAVLEVAEEVAEFKRKEGEAEPPEARVRILLVPGKDLVDHSAAALFGRVLDPSLWEVDVAPIGTLTSELLTRMDETQPAIVVIASMPPGGLTHTRFLCKRIRKRFPELKIAIGRWTTSEEERNRSVLPLRNAGADDVTATLEATRSYLEGWRAVFAAGAPTPRPATAKRTSSAAEIGTVSA
jgi:hypothetical protein